MGDNTHTWSRLNTDRLTRFVDETSGEFWLGWYRHQDRRPRTACRSDEERRGWDRRHRLQLQATRR